MKSIKFNQEKRYNHQEMEQFFVGLMDGDGSIQCNHWKKRAIEYRLVIKLKNTPLNKNMFQEISHHVGGQVRESGPEIHWLENSQARIWKICEIFKRYPPLTSRLICQHHFLQQCHQRGDVHWMLRERQRKYVHQPRVVQEMSAQSLVQRPYFAPWASGWISAEGCFSLGPWATPRFSMGKKDDYYLLESFREKFAGLNRVRLVEKNFYHWQVYRKSVLENILAHCHEYPLLGEKRCSFFFFKKVFPRGR